MVAPRTVFPRQRTRSQNKVPVRKRPESVYFAVYGAMKSRCRLRRHLNRSTDLDELSRSASSWSLAEGEEVEEEEEEEEEKEEVPSGNVAGRCSQED